MYRNVDFKRAKDGVAATVKTIEYDPNRTARIALVVYADGEKSYIIAPNGLQVGQTVMSGAGVAPEVGNTLFLSEIPLGTIVHNIELYPGQGAAMARSAGSYAQLLAREGKFAIIKLPSGETRMVLVTCRATDRRRVERRPFASKARARQVVSVGSAAARATAAS